jgi:hypothetical protein
MLKELLYLLPFNRIKTYIFPIKENPVASKNTHLGIVIGVDDLPAIFKDKTKIIDELIIPEGVTGIQRDTFEKCRIRRVVLPKSLKTIGYSAFSYNPYLKEVIFRDGLEFIGLFAFHATGLKKVELPDSIETIQSSVFRQCRNLKSIKLPKNLRVIEDSLFQNSGIRSIEIPENTREIEASVFWGCSELKKVSIPRKVEKIGSTLFSYSNVKHIYLNNDIKEINEDLFKYDTGTRSVTIEFPNKKGEIVKHVVKRGILNFNKIKKTEDGIVIKTKPLIIKNFISINSCHIITTDGYYHLTPAKLIKLTNDKNILKNNKYDGLEIKLIRWIDGIDKRKKGGQTVFLPSANIIENYPNNNKDIVRYYITENLFDKLVTKIGLSKNDNCGSLLKISYALGLFSDNKSESERAFNFISENLSNKLTPLDFDNLYTNVRVGISYNREFAKFYIENFKDKDTFSIEGYDLTSKMIEHFKDIADSIKNKKRIVSIEEVVRYLSTQKYDYREGNEILAMTISNYSEYYTQENFNKLQNLFEKGKDLAKKEGKLISPTIDLEKEKATYYWSPSDNPINLVLGHADKASCCAKLGGAGQDIMVSAITSSEVQNLIIFDKYRNIVGKGTAFYNVEGKYILFNNAEINPTWLSKATEEERNEVLEAFLRAARDQATALNAGSEEPVITKIHMGMRLNDIRYQIETKKLEVIKNHLLQNYKYGNYTGDANSDSGQVVLYDIEGGKKK